MQKLSLCGNWRLTCPIDRRANHPLPNDGIDITIPGSVLSGLLEHKLIPDPYYREEEYGARDLFHNDYEMQKDFYLTNDLFCENQLDLVCECVDTLADIYINDKLVKRCNNMHRTYAIPIKDYVTPGDNRIRIYFHSTLTYIKDYQTEEGKEISYIPSGGMEGNQFIRKAHSMFGWDWGPQLPDAGIQRDIAIVGYHTMRLNQVRFAQTHTQNHVDLTVEAILDPAFDNNQTLTQSHLITQDQSLTRSYELRLTITCPDQESFTYIETVTALNHKLTIPIENPKLWWPNGYGKQPLYEVLVELYDEEKNLSDSKRYTIGLRTLTISQDKDEFGKEFAFMVNGVKIFAKGANYIPEDAIYSRINVSLQESLIKASIAAHFNCLRIWGGGYYPTEGFYDLCDRYGLIVWQDLMYACNIYEFTKEFEENIAKETVDNVRRLRHHACLGLWCGNNEMESAWDHWPGFAPHSNRLKMDYIKQFEYVIPNILAQEDPNTFYWPSSPSSGGSFDAPDDHNRGDCHYWDVWHGQKPFTDYQKHYFRFCSEFGFQSFPDRKTILSYTRQEDRNIFSKVMESHQKNEAANGKMLYYLSENFRYPKDFDSLIYVTQILQGVAIKSGVEHFRRNRNRCMGALYWQLNDNWPVASWSSIDYFGRWKALHYMAKQFFAPVELSCNLKNDLAKVYVANETMDSVKVKLSVKCLTIDGKILSVQEDVVTVQARSSQLGLEMRCKINQTMHSDAFVIATLTLLDGNEEAWKESYQEVAETFVPMKHMELQQADIIPVIKEDEKGYEIELTSSETAFYVELSLTHADGTFSDNYIAILPEQKRSLRLEFDQMSEPLTLEQVREQLQIRSLRDTYA